MEAPGGDVIVLRIPSPNAPVQNIRAEATGAAGRGWRSSPRTSSVRPEHLAPRLTPGQVGVARGLMPKVVALLVASLSTTAIDTPLVIHESHHSTRMNTI